MKFTDPMFTDETKAREALEAVRWPDGPYCPHCGNSAQDRIAKVEGKKHSHRPGLYYCNECQGQFTVTVGTVFERSKVPLTKWWQATFLMNSSKKGMSAHQLHRMLGVTYKTAWFMAHRIREAMTQAPFAERLRGTVEVDETYIGSKPRRPNQRQYKPLDSNKPDPRLSKTGRGTEKTPVVVLVQRDGMVYSERVANVTGATLKGVIRKHVDPSARIMTDAFKSYSGLGNEYAAHFTVNHLDEYVRGEIHTNTAENFFSILKRGIDGVYHHVSEAHLPRYLSEFNFRYNNRVANGVSDSERTVRALAGAEGKRLRYRETKAVS